MEISNFYTQLVKISISESVYEPWVYLSQATKRAFFFDFDFGRLMGEILNSTLGFYWQMSTFKYAKVSAIDLEILLATLAKENESISIEQFAVIYGCDKDTFKKTIRESNFQLNISTNNSHFTINELSLFREKYLSITELINISRSK